MNASWIHPEYIGDGHAWHTGHGRDLLGGYASVCPVERGRRIRCRPAAACLCARRARAASPCRPRAGRRGPSRVRASTRSGLLAAAFARSGCPTPLRSRRGLRRDQQRCARGLECASCGADLGYARRPGPERFRSGRSALGVPIRQALTLHGGAPCSMHTTTVDGLTVHLLSRPDLSQYSVPLQASPSSFLAQSPSVMHSHTFGPGLHAPPRHASPWVQNRPSASHGRNWGRYRSCRRGPWRNPRLCGTYPPSPLVARRCRPLPKGQEAGRQLGDVGLAADPGCGSRSVTGVGRPPPGLHPYRNANLRSQSIRQVGAGHRSVAQGQSSRLRPPKRWLRRPQGEPAGWRWSP